MVCICPSWPVSIKTVANMGQNVPLSTHYTLDLEEGTRTICYVHHHRFPPPHSHTPAYSFESQSTKSLERR